MIRLDTVFEDSNQLHSTSHVTIAVIAQLKEVWAALTEPEVVSQWLGKISPPLHVGELTNLDFGDGNFFVLEVIQMNPPYRLEYNWRFLGIGHKETITWCISPKDKGCLVTVTNCAPKHRPRSVLTSRKDWLDLTRQLEEFLRKGTPTLCPWHREFYASTEFPGNMELVWEKLIDYIARTTEFVLNNSFSKGEIIFKVKDNGQSLAFQVMDGILDVQNHGLSFCLIHEDWLYPTTCYLNLLLRNQGTMLTVSHIGWEAISFDSEYQKQQRMRFASFWHKFLLYFTLEYMQAWGILTVSPIELQAQMARPNFFVFDSNRITLWQQGHIPGAIFVGQEDIPPKLLPADKSATLVFYCRDSMCLTAYLSAGRAQSLGYDRIFVMEGGIKAWKEAGLPLVSEKEQDNPHTNF